MKAMIFAAGLGTRLKPYTETMPKALVPVAGTPMIEILIRHLLKNGINQIIVNVHHFSGQLVGFLNENDNFGADIAISDESEKLLDTGGGLKKAAWFFDDGKPFLVQNVDVISNLNYKEMLDWHNFKGALCTLAVCDRKTSRYFLFDDQMQLSGWENKKTAERRIINREANSLREFAFSGIHIIDPKIFSLLHQDGRFPIVDTYLELAEKYKIIGFEHDPANWMDMGKPEDLSKAEQILKKIETR